MKPAILLNPGPVTLSERVRQTLLQPDLCHREDEFIDLQNAIRQQLLRVYDLDPEVYAAVLLTGSGTAAVEAMLASLAPVNDKVLIIANGVYGERMAEIAGIYHIPHAVLEHDWLSPVDMDALAATLAEGGFSHVAVVHHETTTGRLNDLATVADICARHDVALLLDGVSSFGAESLPFTDWPIDACAATTNKCLHGVAGVSFVIVKRTALSANAVPRSLYLDLRGYLEKQDANGTPFTQSVQVFYALNEALDEFFDEGGQGARRDSYRKRMQTVREGLLECGIRPLLDEAECSCVLHAWRLPDGIDYPALHDRLKNAGFVIYAGQGDLAKTLFRVSCMGAIPDDELQRFVALFRT